MVNAISTPNLGKRPTTKFNAKAIVDKMFREAKMAAGFDPDAPSYGIQRYNFMKKLGHCIVFVSCNNGLTLTKAKRILSSLQKQFEKRSKQFFSQQEVKEVRQTLTLLQQIYEWESQYWESSYHQVWDEDTGKEIGDELAFWTPIKLLKDHLYCNLSDWIRSYLEWPSQQEQSFDGEEVR